MTDKLIYETRPCKDCRHSKKVFAGWICEKKLMAILPDMTVCYKELEGSCFKPQQEKETKE